MDARFLARGLQARPLLIRQLPRMQQPFIQNTIRHNSSNSSPQNSSETAPVAAPAKPAPSDLDSILDKLDLGNRLSSNSSDTLSHASRRRRLFTEPARRSRDPTLQLSSRKTDLKLGPTLGRQVRVEPERGFDLASAIRTLQVTCNQNKIKQKSNEQKFHVRRGAMKKQLRRSRWRKLFKFSFQETVKKIQRMQAQGW
ncbi:hypothetical protein N7495_000152 [Penicillium taxi]|uniref:uncharacterized protein n=1 Tax=Penicillium taxi TaxID=168475 RepID=UPI0025457C8A|nr:uncharacterized protein N7495_000152 [Penicillium taxi]KAJ5907470.1 hypothetical protein N7495_000152 [Penicillium taxi]